LRFDELHTFADPSLLLQALTHPSYGNEHPGTPDNQRFEFVGDAVLQLIVSEMLFATHPDADEGRLSKARSRVVDTTNLATVAKAIGLTDAIRGGRGLQNNLKELGKVWADVLEAFVAAVYLDAGLDRTREVVAPLFAESVARPPPLHRDSKSELQELCQARGLGVPVYDLVRREGPDHALRFTIAVRLGDRRLGEGEGSSKKEAQFEAARVALQTLSEEAEPIE
jgi:ribonuclease-3